MRYAIRVGLVICTCVLLVACGKSRSSETDGEQGETAAQETSQASAVGGGPGQGGEACEVISEDAFINNASHAAAIEAIDGCLEIDGGLFIQSTSTIRDLEWLGGLRSVTGYVGIADNLKLESLDGLGQLEDIGAGLMIEGNPRLMRVGALGRLERIGGPVHIIGNPSLPTCEAEAFVASFGEGAIGGEVSVEGTDDEAGCP